MAPSEQESGSANGSTTDDPASPQQLVGRLEAHIVELREALAQAQAQAQIRQNAEAQIAASDPLVGPTLFDRDADIAALREARRREGQVRAELETLRVDSANVRIMYDQATAALEAASQRASQARAEYSAAIDVISDRNAAIEQLRRDIATRDREVADLQRRLLEAEEARIADAAAFIDSLDAYKS